MKRVMLAGVLIALFATGGYPDVPYRLRVLTYNIHHGEGTDGQFDLDRIADVVLSAQPDLVALQEVDRGTLRSGGVDQLAELERLTGLHGVFGSAMDFEGGSYGVAVLSRVPAQHVTNHALPGSPDREPRTALTVDVPMISTGRQLQFTSTHLDQGRDSSIRLAQADYLSTVLVANDDVPGILAGDMNSRADTDVIQTLTRRWTDLFVMPGSTDATAPVPRRVDYVFARPAPLWRTVDAQVIDERLASDHRPVLVVLEWTGP